MHNFLAVCFVLSFSQEYRMLLGRGELQSLSSTGSGIDCSEPDKLGVFISKTNMVSKLDAHQRLQKFILFLKR